ncbi:MAG: LamG-like jellyroll fold domain-containing protein [Melioribacteraceae bacterium]|nr:LamG-like jellyroll fold domain-containing protein [Melioribacteraceae bacterium]
MQMIKNVIMFSFIITTLIAQNKVKTVALWTFDEQQGIYPSSILSDQSENDYSIALGPGGQIVSGKFGNALEPVEQPKIILPHSESLVFGMIKLPVPEGGAAEPMTWHNANFCALMTSGEKHLRKVFEYAKPTHTKLNLGEFDWTVEFWFMLNKKTGNDGIVFEIGSGPRTENEKVTRLILRNDISKFILFNQSSNNRIEIKTALSFMNWNHVAFIYNKSNKTLMHYVDGKLISILNNINILPLETGSEDYMSIGRDGSWGRPLQGKLDELRFSEGIVYENEFDVPSSFSSQFSRRPAVEFKKGLPLLFDKVYSSNEFINIGGRKHLFIDDALLAKYDGSEFNVNPPRMAECVIDKINGPFRKHLNVVEDEDGLLRLYAGVENDYLAVWISKDGVNWETPDLPNGKYKNRTNIVIHGSTGMGIVFIDPNAPPEEKWKYLSGYDEKGIFIFTSSDGYNFKRIKTAVLPFWPGSQSDIFYDEQQQKYVAHHRADFATGISGSTQREFVRTETTDLLSPWPFNPVTQQDGLNLSKVKRVKNLLPFYLDNGPLSPGGFGNDYPVAFGAIDGFDPTDTDVYVAKAMKYPWAPDTYIAFPTIYFHYKNSFPETRSILNEKKYQRGSGPLETQLAVSRDGRNWKRLARPVYIGTGKHDGRTVNTAYIAHGMVRRGNEIWQYYFGESQYHSSHVTDPEGRGVYRVIQRLDGFVSLDSPYEKEAVVKTKPFTFEGNRLTLNIDTDAAGYAQAGFADETGKPVEGFSVDDCIYINGDFLETEVEWLNKGKDISSLQGKTLQLVFRMRGSKLYSMQFINK